MVSQKGFAPIAIILVILTVAALGYTGFKILQKQPEETGNLIQTSPSPQPTAQSPTPKTSHSPASTTPTPTPKTTSSTNSPSATNNSNSSSNSSTPTPTSTQSSTPTPSPQRTTADSCSGVTVEGASFVKTYQGQNGTYYQYSINSGATAKLTAQTTPSGGYVNWKIASYSSNLSNGGQFSYSDSNNTSIVNWIAPTNSKTTEEGVDIRGDISEYPNTWKYCPTLTFAIQPR